MIQVFCGKLEVLRVSRDEAEFYLPYHVIKNYNSICVVTPCGKKTFRLLKKATDHMVIVKEGGNQVMYYYSGSELKIFDYNYKRKDSHGNERTT